tara:strand:- start:4692 stop:6341 length:1650 start_codon:yes stop_codon:yes gene_type:complete
MNKFIDMRHLLNYLKFLIISLIIFSCEERVELDYVNFNPGSLSSDDGKVSYSDADIYPILAELSTDTPAVDISIKTGIVFSLDTIVAPSESTYDNSKFTIDRPSGVITYDNTLGGLSEGDYIISIKVNNASGVATYNNAVTIRVLPVPIEINIDNSSVDVGSLQIGVIATASITDLSGSNVVDMVRYQLVDAPDTYEIDSLTGVISKVKASGSGTVKLSVQVGSNVGAVISRDILTVNIGASPTLKYMQLDGSSDLTRVTLSPYTAYTSFAPVLSDMTAVSWDITLPEELSNFSSFITLGSSGELTILADANLPDGDYKIGVAPMNAGGISLEFSEILTIRVQSRSSVVFEDLINSTSDGVSPNTETGWYHFILAGTINNSSWLKMGSVGAGQFSGMRRWMNNSYNGETDELVVREVDLTSIDKTKPTTIVFSEVIGYGNAYLNKYDRAFYFGEDTTNISESTWNDSEWTAMPGLDLAGTDWLSTNWNAGSGPAQDYTKDLNLTTISGDKVYLSWRLKRKDDQTGQQNGQWVVNDIRIEQPDVFTAEEE